MGKTEILLLIASIALGIALMVGMVVPIMKDGKDMVQVKNIAQEISSIKDKVTFDSILNEYPEGNTPIKIAGLNFLKKGVSPYEAINSGGQYSDVTFDKTTTLVAGNPVVTKSGIFSFNFIGKEAGKIDLKNSESIKKLCDIFLVENMGMLSCKFKVE